MITSKKQLKRILELEKKNYIFNFKDFVLKTLSCNEKIDIWNFQKHLRKAEYYKNTNKLLYWPLYSYHIRKKNMIGKRLGIFICINTVDEGLIIYHSGEIVVSGLAKCGKNLKLHGNNCIGNKGIDGDVPIIGDNCDLGFGAVIIGDIKLGNDITIGSNAVVTKSFESGVLVGIPAKER